MNLGQMAVLMNEFAGGDAGGGGGGGGPSAGGAPAPSGGDAGGGGSEPAQVIPTHLGGGDDAAGDDPGADPSKPKPPKPSKYKIKRGGQETELPIDEILKLASDDYEHEIQVSGQPRKAKWQDLVRGYQMSEGAFDRMRQAAEVQKSWGEKLAHGKTDPEWFMQMELGIEDPIRFMSEKLKAQIALEAELDKLYETDRFEFNRRQEQLAGERKRRMDEFQARKKAAQEAEARKAAGIKRRDEILQRELTAAKLPWNETTKAKAVAILEKYLSVGHKLSPADVASMTRDEYLREMGGYLDTLDDESLIKFLGDGRRKKLREYELALVKKGQKKSANDNGAPPARPANTNGNGKSDGISASDFLRSMRGR